MCLQIRFSRNLISVFIRFLNLAVFYQSDKFRSIIRNWILVFENVFRYYQILCQKLQRRKLLFLAQITLLNRIEYYRPQKKGDKPNEVIKENICFRKPFNVYKENAKVVIWFEKRLSPNFKAVVVEFEAEISWVQIKSLIKGKRLSYLFLSYIKQKSYLSFIAS